MKLDLEGLLLPQSRVPRSLVAKACNLPLVTKHQNTDGFICLLPQLPNALELEPLQLANLVNDHQGVQAQVRKAVLVVERKSSGASVDVDSVTVFGSHSTGQLRSRQSEENLTLKPHI